MCVCVCVCVCVVCGVCMCVCVCASNCKKQLSHQIMPHKVEFRYSVSKLNNAFQCVHVYAIYINGERHSPGFYPGTP